MSGHSKWAQIKRSKGAADVKRGVLFSKLSKKISIAVKEGGNIGDPALNIKLRAAVDKAKAASMPNDNIERAIKKGLGENGSIIEEITYEGYGPFGTAFLIEAATDNNNRTVNNIKHILSKHGGNLGGPNSVAWQFYDRGEIFIEKSNSIELEQLEMIAIDNGAIDFESSDEGLVVYTEPEDLETIEQSFKEAGVNITQSEITKVSSQKVNLKDKQKEKVINLIEELENDEDVIAIHHNADL